jgi:hypothetical protein
VAYVKLGCFTHINHININVKRELYQMKKERVDKQVGNKKEDEKIVTSPHSKTFCGTNFSAGHYL